MHWLEQWAYVHFLTGSYLQFWSGVGSDIGELTLVTAVLAGIAHTARINNCEKKGCWRLGLHRTAANHRACRKHHPDDDLTAQDILDAHNAAKSEA
jgi:hypothetical protein